jgi:hypothetical protein
MPCAAVDGLAEEVGMAVVAGVFLDHDGVDEAQAHQATRRATSLSAEVLAAREKSLASRICLAENVYPVPIPVGDWRTSIAVMTR